jgi:hypothetical protein
MTLAEYADLRATMLIVCKTCYHSTQIPGDEAVRRWGADTLDQAIEKRAKCKQIVAGRECGGGARVSWRMPMAPPDDPSDKPHDPWNFSTPGRKS